jgi:protein-S-isoprenylcysteine O-methyltransferase Ste14
MTVTKDTPVVIAPPPLIALAAVFVGVALDWWLPANVFTGSIPFWPRVVAGIAIALGAGALAIAGDREFKAIGTNVEPWKPSLRLATTGIYTRLRNPMYVGLILLVLGIGIAFASDWTLLMAVATAMMLHIGVVLREERYLERKFGDEYRAYKARVSRWGIF